MPEYLVDVSATADRAPATSEPGAIKVDPGSLDAAADAIGRTVASADSGLYMLGDALVRIGTSAEPEAHVARAPDAPRYRVVRSAELQYHIAQQCNLVRWNGRVNDWRPIDPPKTAAQIVLDRADRYGFPITTGFIEAPVITPDGRIIDRPGYDARTGLYLIDHGLHVDVPTTPTRDDATAAIDVICELFATFFPRFVSSVDESAVVAATMQTVLRRVLPHALIVAAMANTPASGKTKLVQMMSIIATGRRAAVVTYNRDQVELEKHMGACAMAGDPLILYDNIDVPVRSPFLCGLTTSPRASFRILGTSERVTLPSNFGIALTGNNLSLMGDITQRVLPIRLDPRCEHPERERFARDAEEYAITQRAAVVAAVLTLVRAYQAAGNPAVDLPPHRDYAVWDRMIRAPIVWLGFPDPLSGLPGLKEDDPELAEIDALLTAWQAWWPQTPQTLAQAVRIARDAESKDLLDAMTGMLGDKRLDARALGYALRRWRDRWVRGRRFVVDASDKNVGHRWTVQAGG